MRSLVIVLPAGAVAVDTTGTAQPNHRESLFRMPLQRPHNHHEATPTPPQRNHRESMPAWQPQQQYKTRQSAPSPPAPNPALRPRDAKPQIAQGLTNTVRPGAHNIRNMHVIIGSCMDKLGWALPLAKAGLRVLVVEKCGGMSDDQGKHVALGSTAFRRKVGAGPGERPVDFSYVDLVNCGRESHSFVWYIIAAYDQLNEVTVFLQGDAHYHLEPAIISRLARVVLELNASPRPLAFVPLCGLPVPSLFWSGAKLPLHCEVYRNFSKRSDSCQAWSSTTHAHFAVTREAIQQHSRRTYKALLRHFEYADGTCLPRIQATVLMERSWGLIFGCARPLGCAFNPQSVATDAEERAFRNTCAGHESRIPIRADGSLDLTVWPQAQDVGRRGLYHEAVAALRSPVMRLPSLADALESMPRWPNPASRSILSGTCWTPFNTTSLALAV